MANKQIGRLWSTCKFEKGWDGRDAEAPSIVALQAAQEIIWKVAMFGVPIPVASVGCEGQSNLFWREQGLDLDVDVHDDVVSYSWSEDNERKFEEEGLFEGAIPPRLIKLLLEKYDKQL